MFGKITAIADKLTQQSLQKFPGTYKKNMKHREKTTFGSCYVYSTHLFITVRILKKL
jgi:hypothetical protein